jgi:hypothetical protein
MIASLSDVERVAFYRKTYTHFVGGVLVFVLLQSDTIIDFMLSMA